MVGRKRHRVTFERATIVQDAYGEADETWTTLKTVWASVEPIRGNEYFEAGAVQANVDVRIHCRYVSDLADLGPADRATYGSNIYDIVSVINVNSRNRSLEVMGRQRL